MDYTWQQPSGNFCPVCGNSHFPFCPPPPPMPYYRPPLPPPLPPQPYNYYAQDQGNVPVCPYPPPQAWNPQWNQSGDYGNSNCGLDLERTGQIGVKRMRVETLGDDARRLRLIRDHGDHVSLCNSSNSHLQQSFQGTDGVRMLGLSGHDPGNVACDRASYPEARPRYSPGSWDMSAQILQSSNSLKHNPNSATYALPHQNAHLHLMKNSPGLNGQPSHFPYPLIESSRPPFSNSAISSAASTLFPISLDSGAASRASPGVASELIAPVSIHRSTEGSSSSSALHTKESPGLKIAASEVLNRENEQFSSLHNSLDEPKVIDASHILKHPYRANRPDYIVIILRGLPGSGKSYLAKILRDLEVENGGCAPRVHSIDEYFMTEIEKVEESEESCSGTIRSKRTIKKKVMEYVYEPEMEEAYRSSMLRSFKKTLDEAAFPFIIVDDRNLRVADFAQFWATAKRSGYEVYLLEASYKDPEGCAARNVHGFTLDDVQKMAGQWEDASSLYMRIDAKSLLHGDDLEGNSIQEVDMDTEETYCTYESSNSEGAKNDQSVAPTEGDGSLDGIIKDELEQGFVEDNTVEVVKELEESKWSNDLDENAFHAEVAVGSSSSISAVMKKPFSKQGKSVRWADQIGSIGFSIGAGKVAYVSLIIGRGSGYNSKSNPMPEEEKVSWSGEWRSGNVFQEQLRAERESFRAVFNKRRPDAHAADL